MAATNDSQNIPENEKCHHEADDVEHPAVGSSTIIHADHSECDANHLSSAKELETENQILLVGVNDRSFTASLATSLGSASKSPDSVTKEGFEAKKDLEIMEEIGATAVQEVVDVHNFQMYDGNLCIKDCEENLVADSGEIHTDHEEACQNSVDVTGELVNEDDGEKECVHKENGECDERETSVGNDHDNKIIDLQQSVVASCKLSDEKDHQESVSSEQQLNSEFTVVIGGFGSLEDQSLCDEHEVQSSAAMPTGSDVVITSPPIIEIRRSIGHYNNHQTILLVGEGDFSFAASLASAFGSASNLTATSLDSRDTVIKEYSRAAKNLTDLDERGAIVIHQVDVRTMNNNLQLKDKLFDRIIFNFPHSGDSCYCFGWAEHDSCYIMCHQRVVTWFFETAREMLRKEGEIHVTHKTAHPYDKWDIVGLAELAGLVLTETKDFGKWMYPGYENKKAYGSSWDSTFPVGQCSTFMFSLP